MVNKSFTAPRVVTDFPQLWQDYPCIPLAETLQLIPETQDLVIHAMGLHWANDPVGQLVQCRRALRADVC